MTKKGNAETTVREAAVLLNKRLDETYKLVQSGRLKGRKLVGRWLIPVTSVEDYKRRARARMRNRTHQVVARPVTPRAAAEATGMSEARA